MGVCLTAAALALLFSGIAFGQAPAPLHARIDEQIAQGHAGPLSPLASDADFVRRIYLDLTGMIPSAAEVRAFLADASPDKRVKLIDQLLASPCYPRHMATVFDVMWMERRRDQHVKDPQWQQYLMDSLAANKPYDQLAREVLSSDGTDPPRGRRPGSFSTARRSRTCWPATWDGCSSARIFSAPVPRPSADRRLLPGRLPRLLAFFSRTTIFVGKDDKKKTCRPC
jgi:hypothetical protein